MSFGNNFLPYMLSRASLKDGCYYAGVCRNANIARWCSNTQTFFHWRTKYTSTFIEEIEYWTPDGKYDGFIPLFYIGPEFPGEIKLPQEAP